MNRVEINTAMHVPCWHPYMLSFEIHRTDVTYSNKESIKAICMKIKYSGVD